VANVGGTDPTLRVWQGKLGGKHELSIDEINQILASQAYPKG